MIIILIKSNNNINNNIIGNDNICGNDAIFIFSIAKMFGDV